VPTGCTPPSGTSSSPIGIAIEDSVVLAEELDRHDPVQEPLEAFVRRRFDRCRLVVDTSWQLT
jgi:hypothetical protein